MSRNSKAKRDQRKKKQPRRPFARLDREQPVANHAVLQDDDGHVVAAIGQQAGGEWILGIGGQTMGSADNPVPMLAMLRHLANLQEKEGKNVSLDYSEQLQQMIDDLAADEGKSADEYLAQLVAEFEGEQEDADDAAEAEAGDAQPADADAKPAS
ncbi:MAG: hypothetical protein QM581_12645 [Pseudomonas sp.]